MSSPTAKLEARTLWLAAGLPDAALASLRFTGDPDSAVNSSFRLGTAAQASIGLSGLSASYFHFLRTGAEQEVAVDARHAILAFHSENWYTVDGRIFGGGKGCWDDLSGIYRTGDNNFVRIHTSFPHHRAEILRILNIPNTPDLSQTVVQNALMKWNATEFEAVTARTGMCATTLRSFHKWDEHPQAQALHGLPPITLVKIGDAPRRSVRAHANRPLDGVRVLDLSRILAGPVAGRTLAAHGADVLFITSHNLPALPLLDIDTSLGKRTAQLDLATDEGDRTLCNLVASADVFLQTYRPGALAAKGYGPQELAAMRPGIVCANLTAWGWQGPWKDRRGFDSLVQTAIGFNVAEAEAFQSFQYVNDEPIKSFQPRPFPVQALDHAAGYLLAFGINAALCKTITEGGSWEVRVSLAAVGQWIRSLGRLKPELAFGTGLPLPARSQPQDQEILDLSVTWPQSGNTGNTVVALKHAAILSLTPVREGKEGRAPVVLNAHAPVWLHSSLL